MKTDALRDWCEEKLTAGADCFTLSAVGLDRSRMLEKVELRDPTPSLAMEVVERVEERAAQHANDHGGRHTFEVQATLQDEDLGLQTFLVHAELDNFTEPSNAGGLLSQMMRHTEAAFRLGTGTALTMQDKSQKMIDRQAERIEHLEGQRLEVLETMEHVFIDKHSRDVAALRTIASEERKKVALGKLMEIAPSMFATVAGKLLPANQMDAVTAHAARDLFEGITESQMQGMLSALPQEKQIAFFQIMKRLAGVSETNEAAAAEKATPANGASSAKEEGH